jgi:hypothetical protein
MNLEIVNLNDSVAVYVNDRMIDTPLPIISTQSRMTPGSQSYEAFCGAVINAYEKKEDIIIQSEHPL